MRAHWAYLKYVLRHKGFVFLECIKLGVPIWIAVLHDWDKFLPDEWFPYVNFFYYPDGSKRQHRDSTGYYKPDDTGDPDFDMAWFLHQKRNRHHWQSWALLRSDGAIKLFPIPLVFLREMIADWRGAGRVQNTPNTRKWYETNKDKLYLHPDTRTMVELIL